MTRKRGRPKVPGFVPMSGAERMRKLRSKSNIFIVTICDDKYVTINQDVTINCDDKSGQNGKHGESMNKIKNDPINVTGHTTSVLCKVNQHTADILEIAKLAKPLFEALASSSEPPEVTFVKWYGRNSEFVARVKHEQAPPGRAPPYSILTPGLVDFAPENKDAFDDPKATQLTEQSQPSKELSGFQLTNPDEKSSGLKLKKAGKKKPEPPNGSEEYYEAVINKMNACLTDRDPRSLGIKNSPSNRKLIDKTRLECHATVEDWMQAIEVQYESTKMESGKFHYFSLSTIHRPINFERLLGLAGTVNPKRELTLEEKIDAPGTEKHRKQIRRTYGIESPGDAERDKSEVRHRPVNAFGIQIRSDGIDPYS